MFICLLLSGPEIDQPPQSQVLLKERCPTGLFILSLDKDKGAFQRLWLGAKEVKFILQGESRGTWVMEGKCWWKPWSSHFPAVIKPLSLPCLLSQSTSWAYGGDPRDNLCGNWPACRGYSINGLKYFLKNTPSSSPYTELQPKMQGRVSFTNGQGPLLASWIKVTLQTVDSDSLGTRVHSPQSHNGSLGWLGLSLWERRRAGCLFRKQRFPRARKWSSALGL